MRNPSTRWANEIAAPLAVVSVQSLVRWASEIAAPLTMVSVHSLVRWASEIAAPLAVVSVHSLVRWASAIAAPLAAVSVPSLMHWANEFRCSPQGWDGVGPRSMSVGLGGWEYNLVIPRREAWITIHINNNPFPIGPPHLVAPFCWPPLRPPEF